jgi:hypothetical protein
LGVLLEAVLTRAGGNRQQGYDKMWSKILDNIIACWGSTIAGFIVLGFAGYDIYFSHAIGMWSGALIVLGFTSIGGKFPDRIPDWIIPKIGGR